MTQTQTFVALAVLAGMLAAPVVAQKPNAAQAALKAAIDREVVDGDLKGAIALYEKTVAQAGADRATAAKALLRMAACHEKLGSGDSQKIYQRVAREYADQHEEAAKARARLGALKSNEVVVTRQVWTGPTVGLNGSVSSDGRFVSYTDRPSGHLMLRDLNTGEDRRLVAAGEGKADLSRISPNGMRVAYVWFEGGATELRLVEIRSGAVSRPRVLFRNADVHYPGPWGWSDDNQTIGVQLQRADRTVQLALLSVNTGTLRVLKTIGWGGGGFLAFSPDGKFLAYNISTNSASRYSDIHVIAVDGSQDHPAVIDPASNDRPVAWSPDGTHLLFLSNREGRQHLYALPMNLGRASGVPILVRENIPNLMGITRAGTIFFGESAASANLFTAPIDLSTGSLQASPVNILDTSHEGVWSPDGRFLAAGVPTSSPGQFWGIHIRSLDTAQVREVKPKLLYVRGFCWIGNSGQFLASGTDLKGRRGLYQIDATTGEAQMLRAEDESDQTALNRRELGPQCSADGDWAVYERLSGKPIRDGGATQIVVRELSTGNEDEILRIDPAREELTSLAISPDGGWIAYGLAQRAQPGSSLIVRSTRNTEARELVVPGPPGVSSVSGWTPDGGLMLIRKAESKNGQSAAEFFLLPVKGQDFAPTRIQMPSHLARSLTLHPGGKLIAFVVPNSQNRRALVAMDQALAVLRKQ